ncbi:hypothetical protein R0G64_31075, partial [Pseudomonas otitidis]
MPSIASVQQHLLDLQHTLAEASRGGVLPASPLPEGLPPGPADSFAAALLLWPPQRRMVSITCWYSASLALARRAARPPSSR